MKRSISGILVLALCGFASAGEWVDLFDGKSLAGWTGKNGKAAGKGWEVVDGTIHRKSGGGDIVSEKEYTDFELEFEWKVSKGANSGFKYRFRDGVGPEYQVLDDVNHGNGKNPKTSAASLYAVAAPAADKPVKPVGEWNKGRIVAKGSKIEHWLNGAKVLELEVGSEEWEKARKASKFKGKADFASGSGKLLMQDHGDEVWFQAIRVRAL